MQQGPNQKPLLGADNNALVALLAINLVAYVMLGFFKVIYFLDGTPIELFYKNDIKLNEFVFSKKLKRDLLPVRKRPAFRHEARPVPPVTALSEHFSDYRFEPGEPLHAVLAGA